MARFGALNPFDERAVPGSVLEIETPIDGPAVWAFSIAAKRYALFTREPDGRPTVLAIDGDHKRSEHGLGHLAPPVPPGGSRRWYDEWWEYLIAWHLDLDPPEPSWFGLASCGRLIVSSPNEERAFRRRNASRSYSERVRPFGFVSTCRPHRLEREASGIRTLVAPFETDPQTRMCIEWVDRHDPSGHGYRVRLGEPVRVVSGKVCVESYGDCFTEGVGGDQRCRKPQLLTRGRQSCRDLRGTGAP